MKRGTPHRPRVARRKEASSNDGSHTGPALDQKRADGLAHLQNVEGEKSRVEPSPRERLASALRSAQSTWRDRRGRVFRDTVNRFAGWVKDCDLADLANGPTRTAPLQHRVEFLRDLDKLGLEHHEERTARTAVAWQIYDARAAFSVCADVAISIGSALVRDGVAPAASLDDGGRLSVIVPHPEGEKRVLFVFEVSTPHHAAPALAALGVVVDLAAHVVPGSGASAPAEDAIPRAALRFVSVSGGHRSGTPPSNYCPELGPSWCAAFDIKPVLDCDSMGRALTAWLASVMDDLNEVPF